MKSYDEMAQGVLQKYGEYKAIRKKRMRAAAGIGVTACCVAVIALAGVGIRALRGRDVTVRYEKPIVVATAPVTDSDGQTVSVSKCGETDEFDREQIEAPAPAPDVPYNENPQVPERPREVEDEPDVTVASTGEHGAYTEPAWTTANFTTSVEEWVTVPTPVPADDPREYDDFIINELINIEGPMSFTQYSEDVRVETLSELKMCDYLGIYLNELHELLFQGMTYVPKENDYTVIYAADGNVLEDLADFTYVFSHLNCQMTIFASKAAPPNESFDLKLMFLSKDPYYISLDNGETLKVVAGRFSAENTDCEYIVADFESYGVYYRIEMKYIPHTLLENVLLEDTIREIATRWHFGDKGVTEESQ